MRDDAIGFVLRSDCAVPECPDVAAWWSRCRAAAQVWRNPLDRAIAAGFGADRAGWAFASGYQAALHALLPGTPEDGVAALCATETEGNRPRAIRSTLRKSERGWTLNGAKRWATLGPDATTLFVVARDAAVGGERAALKVARVRSDAPGIQVQPMPATRFVPEVPHAQLRFDDVPIADDALLPGDGYEAYVKPFRTVEDLHVNAAVTAYLVREARRLSWPAVWIERAAALLHALRALAADDHSAPATHVALAGALALAGDLIREAETHWKNCAGDAAAARWERDRELLDVASSARGQRTARAWERLRAGAAPARS